MDRPSVFLKARESRKEFASWLFDLNDTNYFILETRIGSYLFDAEFNGRGIGEPALFWFGIGLGRLETPQGCGSVRTPVKVRVGWPPARLPR